MVEDVVRALGYLSLGTRMKRIGERLQAQSQEIFDAQDIDVTSVHQAVLAALDRLGPLNIGDLTRAIGTAQPGITRTVRSLEALDLVETRKTPEDRRVSMVGLTAKGERLVARVKTDHWARVEAAVADACGVSGPTLLRLLTELENALATEPLARRAARLLEEA